MNFDGAVTRRLFRSFTSLCRKKIQNYAKQHILPEQPITTKHILKFQKKHPELTSRCRIWIEFVNLETVEVHGYHLHVIDLASSSWFSELCSAVNGIDIKTDSGQSIKGFTRDKLIQNHLRFSVHSRLNKKSYQPVKKYHENLDGHVQQWWGSVVESMYDSTLKSITKHASEHTLARHLNESKFEVEFDELARKTLTNPAQYREFGTYSSDTLLASPDQLTSYLNHEVAVPTKFLIVSSTPVLKQYVSQLNHFHSNEYKPIEAMPEELYVFFDHLIRPVFRDAMKLGKNKKKMVSTAPTYEFGTVFDTLYSQHVHHLDESIKTKRIDVDYHDPLHKSLDGIIVPYFHCLHAAAPKDFKKMIEKHSITPHYKVGALGKGMNAKDVIYIQSGLNTVSHPRSALNLFKAEKDGVYYLELEKNNGYSLISPMNLKIQDTEKTWHSFQEIYNPLTNASLLQIIRK